MIKNAIIALSACLCSTILHAEDNTQHEWYIKMRPKIKQEVIPLLSTQWGQNAPYNNLCPMVVGKDIHCKTGCVATAMAQVMKFYNYPTRGRGVIEYQYNGDDNSKQTLKADLSQSIYLWDKMQNTYNSADRRTAEENEAVARLMADCGAAVCMDYGQYESGAFDMDVPHALTTYFGYDPSVSHLSAYEEHSDSLWFCTLYDQLSQDMPVIYGGITEYYGAHSFVVDGYDANGNFHVVYGLGGGDGYVDLKKIPYRYGRSMTYNIRPLQVVNSIQDIDAQPSATSSATIVARYLPDGRPIPAPQPGINLLKMSDGTIKKVIVR